MAKVLITGGAGFVGSNLISRMVEESAHEITVFDNESLGRREHIAEFGVRFIHGDIRDRPALARALEGVEIVVHLAADTRVMDSIADPSHNFETNVIGTFGLLLEARDKGVKRLINASTGGAILGEAPPPIHEEMTAKPMAPYGASKLAAEGYCLAFQGAYGMEIATLRFSNVYGPRSFHKGSVVAHFFKRILGREELVVYGEGTQVRDYLYTKDLVHGICRAMESNCTGIYQLGSGRPCTLNDLIAVMREVVGENHSVSVRHEEFRRGEIHSTWCNVDKARKELDFHPDTPLAEGLANTWDWFQNHYAAGSALHPE